MKFIAPFVLLACLAQPAQAQTFTITPEERAAATTLKALLDRILSWRDPILVEPGADLQAILDAAKPGDIIQLPKESTFTGNYRISQRDAWVLVRGGHLHSPNTMATLATNAKASYWRFEGTKFTKARPEGDIITLGTGSHTAEDIPHHIEFDGATVLGDSVLGAKRGIAANANHFKFVNGTILDIKRAGQDSQAIIVWNAYGPGYIADSRLEASGENFMAGGADPSIEGLNPTGWVLERVHLRKPVEWKGHPSGWLVKNHYELKACIDCELRDSVLENNWVHGQTGSAIVIKTTNQDGRHTWAETRGVKILRNQLVNVGDGINAAGKPERNPAVPMSDVLIEDNIVRTNRAQMGGHGRCITLQAVAAVKFRHNSCLVDGASTIYLTEAGQNPGLEVTGNIIPDRCGGDCWGIMGAGAGEGVRAFDKWAPGHLFERNLVVTPQPSLYGDPTLNTLVPVLPADTTGYGARVKP